MAKFNALAKRKISGQFSLAGVLYFSALATWRPESIKRHKIFIDALKSEGVRVVLGKFKDKDVYCKECNKFFKAREEKQTDVNIAVHLLKHAVLDNYDAAVLVTNDTDLVPAIKALKELYPQKKVGVLFPVGRWSSELEQICDFSKRTSEKDLLSCQFPDQVTLQSGAVLQRPNRSR